MASPSIVDELVVTLSLDSQDYDKVEARVEKNASRTFKAQQERARKTDQSARNQQRRLKDMARSVNSFGRELTVATTVVAGLGTAVVGLVGNFFSFQTALRQQAIGTGLSVKQMQAWTGTAERMGVEAQAGAQAIANLERERKQFNLTGNGPTLQAFARIGVNADPSRSTVDVLGDAQRRYRAAGAGQKQQIESTLLASGMDPALVGMIKSTTDVQQAYQTSLKQSTDENTKAAEQWRDAMASLKAATVSLQGVLAEALTPAIKWAAEEIPSWVTAVKEFASDVVDAGGGVTGFVNVLSKHSDTMRALTDGVSTAVEYFQKISSALSDVWTKVSGFLGKVGSWIGGKAADVRDNIVEGMAKRNAHVAKVGDGGASSREFATQLKATIRGWLGSKNPYGLPTNVEEPGNPYDLPRNIENDAPRARASGKSGKGTAQGVMNELITKYGMSVAQAAGITANLQAESGLDPSAYNPAGGGTGARGLAQWRGDRTQAFVKRYGVTPDKATLAQQLEFMMTDPSERARLMKSMAKGGSAYEYGVGMSVGYESHGNTVEDLRRGKMAAKLAGDYRSGDTAANVTNVSIQNMSVQTPDAQTFAGGLQRISGTQSYNTVVK